MALKAGPDCFVAQRRFLVQSILSFSQNSAGVMTGISHPSIRMRSPLAKGIR
jgi:hypothetical protein